MRPGYSGRTGLLFCKVLNVYVLYVQNLTFVYFVRTFVTVNTTEQLKLNTMNYYLLANKLGFYGQEYTVVKTYTSKSEAIENHKGDSREIFFSNQGYDNVGWLVQASSEENAIQNVERRKCKNLFKA